MRNDGVHGQHPAAYLALGLPLSATLIHETCNRLLADLQPASGTASQVCALLLAQPGRFPDIEALAQQLGMSSRTLRRKLLAESTSYRHSNAGPADGRLTSGQIQAAGSTLDEK